MTPRIPEAAAGPKHLSRADAVGDLYRRHAVALVRIALLLVGDQASAEDVVHEAFLGLYRNWPALNDHSRLVGYLRVAVVNGSRGVLRARKRAWLLPVRHDPPVWSAEAAAMATEDRREVLAAMLPGRGGSRPAGGGKPGPKGTIPTPQLAPGHQNPLQPQ